MSDNARDDYDSPWKEALDGYFPEFLQLLFPAIHADIDWSRGHEFLDKELQQVVRDAELGRRYADKLVKVHTREGAETWVLIHVEVQGDAEAGFAERMYVYHYRLFDCYGVDVASLAVLADDRPGYRPSTYLRRRWGCEVQFRFPTEKLLDWHRPWTALEESPNPFALVVMAHLKAQETKDGAARKGWKLHLIRLMRRRRYTRQQVLDLFRVIDWLLQLPPALERQLTLELIALEEQEKMPYITSVERIGREIGREEGRQEGRQMGREEGRQEGRQEGEAAILLRLIELKFGPADESVRRQVREADADTLLRWSERVLTAERLDELLH
jgi:hypothetical protein